jgi:RNA polymerase sigma-70 factor (ECF subfamily)
MHQDLDALFSRWIREYGPHLLTITRSFARDHQEAEDLLQEVWLIALRHLQCGREPASERAWLTSVALNVGRAHYRKRKRRTSLLAFWSSELPAAHSDVNVPEVSRHLVVRAVWNCVANLPALQRETFVLRVLEDFSFAEIAVALGKAEGTVKASYHRAKTKIRRSLATYGEDELREILGGRG